MPIVILCHYSRTPHSKGSGYPVIPSSPRNLVHTLRSLVLPHISKQMTALANMMKAAPMSWLNFRFELFCVGRLQSHQEGELLQQKKLYEEEILKLRYCSLYADVFVE